MRQSIRRITNVLLMVGILGLTYSFLSSLTFHCGLESKGCMAALFASFEYPQYQSDLGVAQATPPVLLEGIGILAFIQLLSAYVLLLAVLALVVLECIELHYLRQFLAKKHALRTR